MDTCIFCKIRNKEVKKDFIYEDAYIMVFPDIHPMKPTHLLVVAKKHTKDLLDVTDDVLMVKLLQGVQRMVRVKKLEEEGYKVVINGGGSQVIDHLHIHVIGPIGKEAKL